MDTRQNEPLLEAVHLKKYFTLPNKKKLHAVDDVSFKIFKGETLGLVGESGCGKSTVGNVVMRLLPQTDGKLLFDGKDVFAATAKEKQEYCQKMQIIFQDPYSSLNPRKTIRAILREAYEIHANDCCKGMDIDKKVEELCESVNIPLNLLDHYPHELDGGMRQVVGIARALSLEPEFIVCDEPVSALDVSIQAQLLNLMRKLQREMGLSYIFIAHDLSVVQYMSDRVAVMYLGNVVELADSEELYNNTMHPYTQALLSAVPVPVYNAKKDRIILEGDVPSPMNPPSGCPFHPRCSQCMDICKKEKPVLREAGQSKHYIACHLYDEKDT